MENNSFEERSRTATHVLCAKSRGRETFYDLQVKVGNEYQKFNFTANDFNDAFEKGKLILAGIRTGKGAYSASIVSISMAMISDG